MIIEDDRLKGTGVTFKESPNHGGTFESSLPDTIIIHYTAGSSAESSVKTLCDPRIKASAHLVVDKNGKITQLVPFNVISWHAGKSSYGGRSGFNKYSIGIELDNAGRLTKSGDGYASWFGKTYPESEVIEAVHRRESTPAFWHRYSEDQVAVVFDICTSLIDNYGITSILGHEEIAPSRKLDPGPAFPLDKLRDQVLIRDRANEGDEEPLPAGNVGLVTANRLNIRSSPAVVSSTVAPPLAQGTLVNIIGESDGWYKVQTQTEGWVSKEYIKT
jgi:N-acetylmuramoyl-L-alanine amidase